MEKEQTHYHFIVIAYDQQDKDDSYEQGADIDLLNCKDEEDAIAQTKKMIKRKNYKVVKIICHHDNHENGEK